MRASAETQIISVKTSPAPPIARLPRCTRCQSVGMPSTAEYWSIGETTTRFSSVMPRSRNGWNIGTAGLSTSTSKPCRRTSPATTLSISETNSGARSARLS